MGRETALDSILRLVDSPGAPKHRDEVLVIVNAETGEVLPKKPILSMKRLRYFLVTPDRSVDYGTTIQLFNRLHSRDNLEIHVTCQIQCDKGQETRLAPLAIADNAADALDEIIKNAASAYQKKLQSEEADVVAHFCKNRDLWQSQISQEVAHKCGLMCSALFDIDFEKIRSIPVSEEAFPVSIEAAPDEDLAVSYSARLDLDNSPEAQAKAMLAVGHTTQMRREIVESMKSWVRTNIKTLNQYFHPNNKEAFRQGLLKCTAIVAEKHGRRVSKFDFTLHKPFKAPRPELLEFTAEFKVKDSVKSIPVTLRVMLRCVDLSKFRRAKIRDIPEWTTSTSKVIIRDTFIELTQVEVAINFKASITDEIKGKLEKAAERVGFQVDVFDATADAPLDEAMRRTAPIEHKHKVKIR